ncbi:hypothetical protein ACFVRU_38015 [Streptomyces sp. NPDC057927]
MSLPPKDRKTLWGLSGNECAFPECRKELVADLGNYTPQGLGEGVTLGEEAHIIADNDKGPRADPSKPKAARDSYANMILLCEEHHKVIDASGGKFFTVSQLHLMKTEHEEEIRRRKDRFSIDREEKDGRISGLLREWEAHILLDDWDAWTSCLLSPHPFLARHQYDHLYGSLTWMRSRFFPPGEYKKLVRAFENFSLAWRDLMQYMGGNFKTRRFDTSVLELHAKYKEIPWDPPLYHQLGKEFDLHCDALHLLVMEASAAANFLLSSVREGFDPMYRFEFGHVTITRGPDEMFRFQHSRPEYSDEQLGRDVLYPGMDDILDAARANARRL